MPITKTGLSDKAQLATDHYIANVIINPIAGYNWSQAMRDATYADSTINKTSGDIWGKPAVQEQIIEARNNITVQAKHDRNIALNNLYHDHASLQAKADTGDTSAVIARTAIQRELNAISALHSQTVNTQNKTLAITVKAKE